MVAFLADLGDLQQGIPAFETRADRQRRQVDTPYEQVFPKRAVLDPRTTGIEIIDFVRA